VVPDTTEADRESARSLPSRSSIDRDDPINSDLYEGESWQFIVFPSSWSAV
jgi:hypothetical protein